MLVLLTSKWRQRAATVLVTLYALCLLAPATVFAFSDSSAPAHCLTTTDHHMGLSEGSGPSDHGDAGHDQDQGLLGKCCGLFCVTAAAPEFNMMIEPATPASAIAATVVEDLFGRSSSGIDRPPRPLSFV